MNIKYASRTVLSVFAALGLVTAGLAACSSTNTTSTGILTSDASADGGTIVGEGGATDGGPTLDANVPAPIVGKIDRAGRPAIAYAFIADPAADGGISRDDFNHYDVFGFTPTPDSYNALFQAELVGLDAIDGVDNWKGGAASGNTTTTPNPSDGGADAGSTTTTSYPHPLVSVLTGDYLLVDPNKPFSATGFLDVENAFFVTGAFYSNKTCGGRWPGDDAVDKLLSVIVTKSLTGISDGVNAATKPPSLTFPYLAAPN